MHKLTTSARNLITVLYENKNSVIRLEICYDIVLLKFWCMLYIWKFYEISLGAWLHIRNYRGQGENRCGLCFKGKTICKFDNTFCDSRQKPYMVDKEFKIFKIHFASPWTIVLTIIQNNFARPTES